MAPHAAESRPLGAAQLDGYGDPECGLFGDGRRWRRDAPGGVDLTHEADGFPIRVLDDGVARPPECVIGRLLPRVAGTSELCIQEVHFLADCQAEVQDDACL